MCHRSRFLLKIVIFLHRTFWLENVMYTAFVLYKSIERRQFYKLLHLLFHCILTISPDIPLIIGEYSFWGWVCSVSHRSHHSYPHPQDSCRQLWKVKGLFKILSNDKTRGIVILLDNKISRLCVHALQIGQHTCQFLKLFCTCQNEKCEIWKIK
jgi:hypothetical protein